MFAIFSTWLSSVLVIDRLSLLSFFFQVNFNRIREIRQRRRKERQNPKPGKLQRFFHAVLSVITLECCRRKTIPKMTASGTVLSVAYKLLTHAQFKNGDGTWDESANAAFSVTLAIQASRDSVLFVCGTQRILGQKVTTECWMAAISSSPLREYCYCLVLSSNIRVKEDKMKRENNPIRLPLETWCSLSVPQCTASNKGNWNSWCLYWSETHVNGNTTLSKYVWLKKERNN